MLKTLLLFYDLITGFIFPGGLTYVFNQSKIQNISRWYFVNLNLQGHYHIVNRVILRHLIAYIDFVRTDITYHGVNNI